MSIRARKFVGTIALLVLVTAWGLLAMALAQSVLTDINGVVAAIYYIVAGLGWVLPAMPLMSWMSRPDHAPAAFFTAAPRRRADPAEAVREGHACAGHQHFQIALLLELATDRDARQRGQVIPMRLEKYAGPCRHCCLETELGCDTEFAGAGRHGIADRVCQMFRTLSEGGFQNGAAHLYFRAHGCIARYFLEHHMINRVGADGAERIRRKLHNFWPIHAQVAAERQDIDAVGGAQIPHGTPHSFVALHAAQININGVIKLALFPHGRAFEILVLAVDHHADPAVLGNHGFDREPPQFAQSVGKTGRDIHRERHLVFPQ